MPAKSQKQANLMRAAEHGADFPMARKVRGSMSAGDLHDFASTKSAGLPEKVGQRTAPATTPRTPPGASAAARVSTKAMAPGTRGGGAGLPHPHRNLGGFLHPKRGK